MTFSHYIFNGHSWQSVTTEGQPRHRPDGAGTPLNLWRPPRPQNQLHGHGDRFDLYRAQPCFVWVGDWARNPKRTVANYVWQADGNVIPICLYGFPRSGYSKGGHHTFSSYKRWINAVSAGLGSARAMLVLEPDALGVHRNITDGTTPERALAYAVSTFEAANPRTAVYIDASSWVDPDTQARRLRAANIDAAAGFATNVSGFKSTSSQVEYCEQVNARLRTHGVHSKRYIIDTGRNGNGHLTHDFGRVAEDWLRRGEGWLNPPGRGLGISPRGNPDPSKPNFAAAVWVKTPGVSDGNNPGSSWFSRYFRDRAPSAGQYWMTWIQDCLKHTDMSNLRPPT